MTGFSLLYLTLVVSFASGEAGFLNHKSHRTSFDDKWRVVSGSKSGHKYSSKCPTVSSNECAFENVPSARYELFSY